MRKDEVYQAYINDLLRKYSTFLFERKELLKQEPSEANIKVKNLLTNIVKDLNKALNSPIPIRSNQSNKISIFKPTEKSSKQFNPNGLVEIYTDGGTIGRNTKITGVKPIGLGVYIPKVGDYQRMDTGLSINEAEFKALLWACTIAIEHKITKVAFYLDSRIVVNRANGRRPTGKSKNLRMDAFQDQLFKLIKSFKVVTFTWIPRHKNTVADSLVKTAKSSYYKLRS